MSTLTLKSIHFYPQYTHHTTYVNIEGVGQLETKVALSPKLAAMIEEEVLNTFANSAQGNAVGKVLQNVTKQVG